MQMHKYANTQIQIQISGADGQAWDQMGTSNTPKMEPQTLEKSKNYFGKNAEMLAKNPNFEREH